MAVVRYVSHPEVVIDPAVPVPEWGLTEQGRERTRALAGAPWMAGVRTVVASDEVKAIETAEILARSRGLAVEVRSATAEVDRSSTGYLAHDEHEAHADALFARPDDSIDGWETAAAAQARVVAALADLFEADHDVVVVGHGGVGTLWWCHLSDVAIARDHDQPYGGHLYDVDAASRRPTGPWRPFEAP